MPASPALTRIRATLPHFTYDADNPNGLVSQLTVVILAASDGAIWVGTQDGLSRLDPKTNTFSNFTAKNSHLSDGVVNALYEDSRETIWVGTSNGLNKFDPSARIFTAYYVKDGLSGNAIGAGGIAEDNQGFLWVGTNGGLSKFDPDAETFRNYDERDGLQSNQVGVLSRSPSGEFFAGGVNGFNTFYPDKLADNPHAPKIVLTNFQLLNRAVNIGDDSPLQRHINVTDHITLPYDYIVFTLRFAALNYRSPQKNQYAYMMEGFDGDWRFTTADRRFATYTNLDHGSYTFRVKASNNDGVWNEEGKAIKITITPTLVANDLVPRFSWFYGGGCRCRCFPKPAHER